MVLEAEESKNETYAVRMLAENKIQGLLPFHEKQMDGKKRYYYDITSKQPLSRILEYRNLSGRELERLISDLMFALRQIERFFLDEGCLDLEPEVIYVEPDSFKSYFCLVPGKSGDFAKGFCGLSQCLLDHADHRDGDAVVLAFSVFKECRKDNFGIEDIEKCLRKREERTGGGGDETDKEKWRGIRSEKDEGLRMGLGNGTDGESAPVSRNRVGEEKKAKLGERMAEEKGERYRQKENEMEQIWDRKGEEQEKRDGKGKIHSMSGGRGALEGSRFLRAGVYIIPVLGMALIPLVSFWLWGLEGVLQYKWILGAAELLLGTILFILAVGGKQDGLPENREECQKDREPWEVYFSEEKGERAENEEPFRTDAREKHDDGPEEMQTILLTARPIEQECRKLVAVNGDIEISLGYFPFIIGKSRGMADFCLNEPGVSRLHIKIEGNDGGYFVTDLNSTNGTRINGELLEANETRSLPIGSELEIASRKFRFR